MPGISLSARLSDDEKRLFALICRSYLAAVMPDFEYRQTVVTMKVPVPQQASGAAADFRAVGRIPLVQGWKAAFGAAEPESGREKDDETETEQALPQLVDGQSATLSDPRVQAKQTQPPPRYSEGTTPPPRWSIPGPRQSGRCGSTMSW